MATISKLKKTAQIHGYSILEVIVSTIIILISFLLFSSLIGQLVSSRNIVSETKMLLQLNRQVEGNIAIDTTLIKDAFGPVRIETISAKENTIPFDQVLIRNTSDGKILYQFSTLRNYGSASLFQN